MTTERDQKRERWRMAALEAAAADDRAARLREGRDIFLDQLVETLIEQSDGKEAKRLTGAAAERMARTSAAYKRYLATMHDARNKAAVLKIEAENQNRVYWEGVAADANYRAEMRMTQ